MAGFTPTGEQMAAADAFRTEENMVLEAGAGTGKTSTLKVLGSATPNRSGLYLAFNKTVASEAAETFPENVRCSTVHSLAYREVMPGTGKPARMRGARQTSRDVAQILGIRGPHRISKDRVLAPNQVARIVMETVNRFCHSADESILSHHTPRQPGIDTPDERLDLAMLVLPLARRAWADIVAPAGSIKYGHDHYVKEWQLRKPRLDVDFVFVDEAQDSDPVLVDVVNRQKGAQIVAVGDRCQAIYGWRGAVDAMDSFGAVHHLYLTQSFRFGQAVADEANKWLGVLDATLRLAGTPTIPSRVVDHLERPTAVLARTNAGALEKAMTMLDEGQKPALVGGGGEITRLAEAARDLMEKGQTWHPELCVFTSWSQVQDYVEEDFGGQELGTIVRLVDKYGTDKLLATVGQMVPEEHADLVISTAHKAKGREWADVVIADDFKAPGFDVDAAGRLQRKPIQPADAMLAYVSVTRAKRNLVLGGLGWLDDYLAETAAAARVKAHMSL